MPGVPVGLMPGTQVDVIRATRSRWTAVAIQPNTDTIWVETGINSSSQGVELSTVWLVISLGLADNPVH